MPCIRPGAGLLFCPTAIQPHTNIYSGLCAVNAIIPPQQQNRLQDFTGVFPSICPISAHTIQQPHKPPIYRLHHVGGHTVKRSTSTDAQIPPPRRTLYRSTQPPIIIRYIRAQRCGISQTMPARRGSPAAGARLAARNHWRLSPQLFSGFRPIANRGQQ